MTQTTKNSRTQSIARWSIAIAVVLGFAAWLYIAPAGLMGKLDAIGYAVCHRLDSHSLHVAGVQLPLCARCTGEFNAAAVALVFQAIVSPRKSRLPGKGILAVLAAFFLAFALDGSNSYLALMRSVDPGVLAAIPVVYVTTNVTRIFTGTGMGLALAAILYPLYNQSVWETPEPGRALDWRKFGLMMAVLMLIDFGMLTESPWILYPVAVSSALGVLALLTIVFSIVWITIMRQDNTFSSGRQLWLPAGAGLTLAFVMILGIDLVRLAFTHTWGGFPGLQG